MFCPVCKAEYRTAYTRCSDCDVELVEELDSSPAVSVHPQDPQASAIAWTGTEAQELGALCRALDATSIPYARRERDIGILPGLSQPVYAILVNPRDLEAAQFVFERVHHDLEISEASRDGEAAALSHQSSRDIGEEDENLEAVPDDIPEDFRAEDATAEIWTGKDRDTADALRMCLRENGIGCVAEEIDAEQIVRVMPGSAARARRIIREVVEGNPLA
jgi:hypothetical protein